MKVTRDKVDCVHVEFDDDKFVAVTEWANGEGWDVDMDGQRFGVSWEEWDALCMAITMLRNNVSLDVDK